MSKPKTCADCSCLKRDEDTNPITEINGGVECYICLRPNEEKFVAKQIADTQAICMEVED